MARAASLEIGDQFYSWKITQLIEKTKNGSLYEVVCTECQTAKNVLGKNVRVLARCGCTPAPDRGRRSTVRLQCNGQLLSIKECAKLTNPEDPAKAEIGIRNRLYQRNSGRPLTDAQVVWGLNRVSWDDRPLEVGLFKITHQWIVEELTSQIPDMADRLAHRLVNYIVEQIEKQRAEDLTGGKGVSLTPSANMASLIKTQTAAFIEEATDENMDLAESGISLADNDTDTGSGLLSEIKDWLRSMNYVDESYTWIHGKTEPLSVSMLEGYDPSISIQENHDRILQEIDMDFQAKLDKQEQYELAKANPPVVQVRLTAMPLIQFYDSNVAFKEPTDFERETFPPLTVAEIREYEALPWVMPFTTSDVYHLGDCRQDRSLKSMDDFNLMLYNPSISRSTGVWGKAAGYHDFCFYDLAWRCIMGIVDHRSFNRAMELYFMGQMLSKPYELRQEGDLIRQMYARAEEMHHSMLDLRLSTHFNPAVVSNRRDEPIPMADMSLLQDFLTHDEAELSRYVWNRASFGTVSLNELPEGEMPSLLRLIALESPYFPDYVDEDDATRMISVLEAVSNYGRNQFHWPEYHRSLPIPYPHLIPCELYWDESKPIDYTVYDGAPLPEDGTWSYINLVEGVSLTPSHP